ncbi:MAG: DoxX family protein [Myxococcota bacterium]
MEWPVILQVLVAVILLVTWTVNFNRATVFRGGDASSMKAEFAVYGLPEWSVYVVGGLKIICSIFLLIGIAVPSVVAPAALVISVLMFGALAMHLKVKDRFIKWVPASFVFLASVAVFASASNLI